MKHIRTPAHPKRRLLCCSITPNASLSARPFSSASNFPSFWRGAYQPTLPTTPPCPSPLIRPPTCCSTCDNSHSPLPNSHPQLRQRWRVSWKMLRTLWILLIHWIQYHTDRVEMAALGQIRYTHHLDLHFSFRLYH